MLTEMDSQKQSRARDRSLYTWEIQLEPGANNAKVVDSIFL